jgi:hypothetical protein
VTATDPLRAERDAQVVAIREEERQAKLDLYEREGTDLPEFGRMTPTEIGDWYRVNAMRFIGGTVDGKPVGIPRARLDEVTRPFQLRVNAVMGRGPDGEMLKDERRRVWKLNREEESHEGE